MVEQAVLSGAGGDTGAAVARQGATDAMQTQVQQIERENRDVSRLHQLDQKGKLTDQEAEERSALALFPGNPEAQKLFENRRNSTEEEQNKLSAWLKYKRPEQARERELSEKIDSGQASDADKKEAKLWDQFGHNPDAVDLAKRKESGEKLSDPEQKRLDSYAKATEQSAPGANDKRSADAHPNELVMDNPYANKDNQQHSGPPPSDTRTPVGQKPNDQGSQNQNGQRQGDAPPPPPQQVQQPAGAQQQSQGDMVSALAALYPNDSQLVSEYSRYLQGQQLQPQELADLNSKIKFPNNPASQSAYYSAYLKQSQGQPLTPGDQAILQQN